MPGQSQAAGRLWLVGAGGGEGTYREEHSVDRTNRGTQAPDLVQGFGQLPRDYNPVMPQSRIFGLIIYVVIGTARINQPTVQIYATTVIG